MLPTKLAISFLLGLSGKVLDQCHFLCLTTIIVLTAMFVAQVDAV